MLAIFLFSFVFAREYRIVSLNPTLTEILFELGEGGSIVGTTQFSDYPEAAKKIKRVGTYLRPQIEKIVELKPTHVIAYNEGDPSYVDSLKKANVPLFIFESRKLEQYEQVITKLSQMFKSSKGKSLIKKYNTDLAKIIKNKINKKVLIQVDQNPLIVAGGNTFISQGFEKCGLKNVFQKLDGFKQIQMEAIKENQPDIILILGQLSKGSNFDTVKEFWRNNPLTKNAKFVWGDPDTLSRLSPRFTNAIYKVCSEL